MERNTTEERNLDDTALKTLIDQGLESIKTDVQADSPLGDLTKLGKRDLNRLKELIQEKIQGQTLGRETYLSQSALTILHSAVLLENSARFGAFLKTNRKEMQLVNMTNDTRGALGLNPEDSI